MSFKKKAVGCKRGVVVMYATTPEEAESIMWIWDLPVSVRIYIHVDKKLRLGWGWEWGKGEGRGRGNPGTGPGCEAQDLGPCTLLA